MSDLPPVIKTLIAEALGEGPEGMRLVGETILNRSQQRGIPPDRVVAQPYQYTGYSNPGPAAQRAFNDPSAISAAEAAWQLAQGPGDPTQGANHYYAQNTIAQPSWARNMTNTVTSGGHTFYTDRPFTQRSIPAVAPTLAQITPTTAALRQMTSPSGGNTELQSALNRYATRERNRVEPASAEDRVNARNRQFFAPPQDNSALAAAARRASLSMGSNQTYAGQERGPQRFNGDPMTPSNGPVVATFPTTAQRTVPMSRAPVSYAGQERMPPARMDGIGSMPSFAQMGATLGRSLAPSQVPALYNNVFPRPLASNVPNRPGGGMQVAILNNTVGPSGLRNTSPSRLPPIPMARSANQVGTQLSVARPTSPAPTPFMRPAGLGQRPMNAAPVPMMRPAGLGGSGSAAPTPFMRPTGLGSSMAPAPVQRSAPMMAPVAAPQPMMGAPVTARPTVYVRGSNTIQSGPVAQPQSLYYSNPVAFGSQAVSLSGDDSVGNQREAAQARASGGGSSGGGRGRSR
jgi:hypothetical protein